MNVFMYNLKLKYFLNFDLWDEILINLNYRILYIFRRKWDNMIWIWLFWWFNSIFVRYNIVCIYIIVMFFYKFSFYYCFIYIIIYVLWNKCWVNCNKKNLIKLFKIIMINLNIFECKVFKFFIFCYLLLV